MKWQPIETAPKDSTRIDVWINEDGGYRITDVEWHEYNDRQEEDCLSGFYYYEHEDVSGSGDWLKIETATHWMPLPQPPGNDADFYSEQNQQRLQGTIDKLKNGEPLIYKSMDELEAMERN